ncbi:hypothetical protein SAMN05421812_101448 [Asanoa hainanensis]|uniref:Uncharacterized protein n=1 Tax=Asanoa hainanensis TaxID=560556 RepID=A0A239GJV6_9ACTN|nr:hypothetical protein [Asanoa hainanensis]SNS69586.1 hypothetical protein SAMN05421812_101448 [Asanoa hainanensis]
MQPLETPPTPRRPPWLWLGGFLGLLLAVGMFRASYSGSRPEEPVLPPIFGTFVVSGAVVLGDSASFTKDGHGGCAGTGAHAGVVDGARVVVTTSSGSTSGTLTLPRLADDGTCWFSFSVPDVPSLQAPYAVVVAGEKAREYTEQELTAGLTSLRLD